MDEKFARLIERLHPSFVKLKECSPFSSTKGMPEKGVYLFSEKGNALYVGRSDRIPKRYGTHRSLGARENQAAFAYILACETIERPKVTYKKGDSRKDRMKIPAFRKAFDDAKHRIRAMEFRAVSEDDPTCQALLEVYCAVALATPHNNFRNH